MEGIPKPLVKKSRSANWLSEEKELLKTLVKEQVLVIENKNTDANTNKKKIDAWKKLCSTFNEVNSTGVPRTVKNLKTQWSIIKMVKKKALAKARQSITKTGGGSQSPVNHDDDEILSWLPNEFVVDSNEFDSDSVRANIPAETPGASPLIKIIYEVSPEAVENKVNIDMDTSTTQLPLTESHPQLEPTHTEPQSEPTIQPNPKRSKNSKSKRQNKLSEDKENVDLNKQMEKLIAMQLQNEEKRARILDLQIIFWEKKCGSFVMLQTQIVWIRHITAKADIVMWSIRDLLEEIQPAKNAEEAQYYANLVKSRMSEIIKQHNSMYDLMESYACVYKKLLMFEQKACCPVVCLTSFCTAEKLDRGEFNAILVLLCVSAAVNIFIPSFLCTFLLYKIKSVCDACWNSKFWNAGPVIRPYMVLMMQRALRPLPLQAPGFEEVSIETFSKKMTAAYSYFNMLRQTDL